MIGLVIKDFYVLRQSLKIYLLLLGLYAVMTATGMFTPAILCGIMGMMIIMMPISSFSYDDMARWDKYAASLPVGRKGIVRSKYVFTSCIAVIAFVTGIALCAVLAALKLAEESLSEVIMINLYCVLTGLFLNAVLSPFVFKFGAEKSRIFMFVIFAVVFGGIAVAGIVAKDAVAMLEGVLTGPAFMTGMTAFILIAFAASYFISLRIFEKKEL